MGIKLQDKMARLVAEVNRHNRLYYADAAPEITDQEYDKLLRDLVALEKKHPELVLPESPTQRVGNELKGDRPTVEHTRKMLSLNNTYNEQELRDFDARVRKELDGNGFEYSTELKIDGAAVSLWYEEGLLVKGLTRGDGVVGEDITDNIKTIRSIPIRLDTDDPPDFVEIRGEVYMSRKTFAEINKIREEEGKEEPFANPRNAAAGSMKQKDPKEVAGRKLAFFAHTFGGARNLDVETHSQFLRKARSWGLTPVRSTLCRSIDDVWALIQKVDGRRKSLEYDTDGIVVKVDSLALQRRMGHTSKAPKYAMAYKYPAEQAETTLKGIDIQVGKTGVLTPVGRLEPVRLGGSTISNVSICNQDEIDRLDCRVGDRVKIQKSGEIIPKIVSVVKEGRAPGLKPYKIPRKCPDCGSTAERKDGEVAIKCLNPLCKAKLHALVEYFVSRKCMDIDGVGESLITKLIDAGLIGDPSDLYNLTEEDFKSLDGIKSSASKYVRSIAESKSRDLSRVIASLNIPLIGRTLGETLAIEFGSLEALRKEALKGSQHLTKIDKLGAEKASSIAEWFKDDRNSAYVDRLISAGMNTKSKTKRVDNPLFKSKTFVLTGTLDKYSRDSASALIKERGGRTSGSVSKKTDYVLAGESAGSKLKKARDLGVEIISETAFEKMLAGQEGEGDP